MKLYYFVYGRSFAIVENAGQARRYTDAGWQRVSRATCMQAWRDRDVADLAAIRKEQEPYETQTQPSIPQGHWH